MAEAADHQWWVGDWLNFGELAYGEKYAQAMDAGLFDYGYLRNVSYVAAQIEPSRRRDGLSWSHHQEVAALEPSERDKLLDRAEADGSKAPTPPCPPIG